MVVLHTTACARQVWEYCRLRPAETDGAGKFLRAEVRLPVKLTINTPKGVRDAGTAGDKLKAGAVTMPPLQLSDESVKVLKGMWN